MVKDGTLITFSAEHNFTFRFGFPVKAGMVYSNFLIAN